LRWLREPRWSSAVAIGVGTGVAAGSKVLGIAYGLALGGGVVLLARGRWTRRAAQLAAAAALVTALGGWFYLRDVAVGAGPLAAACERTARGPFADDLGFPRHSSVLDIWGSLWSSGQLAEAFLGTTRPQSMELGVGPQAPLLLLGALALPFLARGRRRAGLLVALQVAAQLAFWLAVPFARNRHVYANVRYLVPTIGLCFAG